MLTVDELLELPLTEQRAGRDRDAAGEAVRCR